MVFGWARLGVVRKSEREEVACDQHLVLGKQGGLALAMGRAGYGELEGMDSEIGIMLQCREPNLMARGRVGDLEDMSKVSSSETLER